MEKVTTNLTIRNQRIEKEVNRAFQMCKDAANDGRTYIYFNTERDIQREVRDMLETNHNIYVPMIISRYEPSRIAVEHNGDNTEIKLTWAD